jgi:nucleoprotein TPR
MPPFLQRLSNFKDMLRKMQVGLKSAKDAEDKAKSTEKALQKEITELKHKLAVAESSQTKGGESATEAKVEDQTPVVEQPKTVATETPAVPEKKIETTTTTTTAASDVIQPDETADATKAAPVDDATEAAPLVEEKPSEVAASSEMKVDASEKAPVAATKKKGKKRKAAVPQKNAAPSDTSSAPPQKKSATQDAAASAKASGEKTGASESIKSTTHTKQAPVPPKKKIVLKKKAAIKETPASTPAAAPAATAKTTAASTKEEEMKLKMLLLKKRKAEAAQRLQVAKKKKETEAIDTAAAVEESEKMSKESAPSITSASEDTPKESESNDKPVAKAVPALSSPRPLPPVPKKDEPKEEMKEPTTAAVDDKKDTAAIGSSASVAGATGVGGIPAAVPPAAEPDCPKPSFFGESSTTAAPTAIFGNAAPSTKSIFIGGAVKPSNEAKKAESADAGAQPAAAKGAFLNLTPPGKAKAAQFVFGNSANITLPVPASSPFGVFSGIQKTTMGSTPFGSGFGGIATPFGGQKASAAGEEQKKEDSGAATETTQPDEKKEKGEVAEEECATKKDPVAKKA